MPNCGAQLAWLFFIRHDPWYYFRYVGGIFACCSVVSYIDSH